MFDTPHAEAVRSADDSPDSPWTGQRRPPRDSDFALSGPARQWLRKLPTRRRPVRLCDAFPRVANRVAWCWPDPSLVEQMFDDLLVDRRGGRMGFPAQVVRELRRLREFNQQQRGQAGGAAPNAACIQG